MIISQFYQDILTRLIDADIGIQHFDLYRRQVAEELRGKELSFNLPAVFMRYQPIAWENVGRNRLQADVSFELIVASEVGREHDSVAQPGERSAALAHLELLDRITANLQGASGEGWGSIGRTAMSIDDDYDRLYVHSLVFRSRLTDTAARDTWQTADPQPTETVTINVNDETP